MPRGGAPGTGAAPRLLLVAALLLGSGFCSLVYQVVWLREFRLVFGASTMASAAVLAVFMGGLGFGGLYLGRRADRKPRPLAFYARLELGIAAGAALTPFLVDLASRLYFLTGGSPALGPEAASGIRVALTALVLGAVTFLMGGTLPAASRSVASERDAGRRGVAALYGANTLGAAAGALVPTFFLFERIGIHATLWSACVLNLLVALAALGISRRNPVLEPEAPAAPVPNASLPPTAFVLFAAALAGFVFLVMEMVWYRMLGPILGGSTYTFGLILGLVLLGIGGGGILYALAGRRRPPTVEGFAVTCTWEALFLAVPFALGDRIAGWALLLQPSADEGFGAQVAAWTLLTAIVVLPAAVVAGVQFPLLIALLGRGRRSIGRQVGQGYAWNTIGAIAGSLAGGFGLLEAMSAPGVWVLAVWILLALAAAGFLLSLPNGGRKRILLPGAAGLGLAAVLASAEGPTAAWRHAPVGAGRIDLPDLSANGLRKWMNETRRSTLWEAEGREASVALQSVLGLSFAINGKSDGSARYDAPTQVMYGLVGAVLHPNPRSALVIGLGTGSTAGWLAAVPTIERVDVAELEPAILEVARASDPVNRSALDNPRVHVFLGDGREMLLAARSRYDLVASEPSNPYRAGIASLFTRECYRAVRSRLNPGGLFLQWLQAYEVDEATIRTVVATLGSVFERVEIWQTAIGDLLLVCSMEEIRYDPAALRTRLSGEPFRSALARTWRVSGLEGFLSRYVASPEYAREVAREKPGIETDDRPRVEFGFARTVGRTDFSLVDRIRDGARSRGLHRPPLEADWPRVERFRASLYTLEEVPPPRDLSPRAKAHAAYLEGDLSRALRLRAPGTDPPDTTDLTDLAVTAHLLAHAGDGACLPLVEALGSREPVEGDVLAAVFLARTGEPREAAAALARAFRRHRADPWPWPYLVGRGLVLARELSALEPATAPLLFESLIEPFSVRQLEHDRLGAAMEAAKGIGAEAVVRAFEEMEPHFLWNRDILTVRAGLYRELDHRFAERAERDLREYLRNAGERPPR